MQPEQQPTEHGENRPLPGQLTGGQPTSDRSVSAGPAGHSPQQWTREEAAPHLSQLRSRPATDLPEADESESPAYHCTDVHRFPAKESAGSRPEDANGLSSESLSADRETKGRSRGKRRRRAEAAAVSQGVFFLLTVALLFAAARFLLPTIVEEVRYGWHRGQLRAEYESSGDGLRNVSLDSLSHAYQMVTQRVGPSVVHIDVQRQLTDEEREIAELMRRGLGSPEVSDQGSGVVVDEDGHILTNEHVIAGGEAIQVGLSDGRRVPATVVGIDPLTDLAVLKISADGLMPITFGDSEKARVGAPVWAVGSPFGLDRTITFGILSGKHRIVKASTRYQDFMQSDVAVNPGNSGGPLVNVHGELIGINTAIVGDTYRGVSFSIPSNVAHRVYQRIRESGVYRRGWLGVGLTEVPDDQHTGDNYRVRGAMVTGLTSPDSPAAIAGLQVNDIIKSVDGTVVTDMGHLMRLVGDLAAGEEIELEVLRDEEVLMLRVMIGERPAEFTR